MAFKDILLDVRSMRRSAKIRNETDPEKVANILEELLKETIHMQNSGDKSFQKKTFDELKQIRRDLIAGQINAGSKTGQMTAVYSGVIDTITKIESENTKSSAAYGQTVDALRKSIPSTDSLVSALMTANPIIGYGVKMVRDLSRSSADRKREEKAEAARRIEILKKQHELLTQQFEAAKEAERMKDDPKDEDHEKTSTTTSSTGVYDSILEDIQNNIKKLVDIWSDSPTDGTNVADNLNADEPVVDELTRIGNLIEELKAADGDNTDAIIKAERELEDERNRQGRLNDMSDTSTNGPPIPLVDNVDSHGVVQPQEEKSFLGGILKLIGGLILSAIGGIAGLVAAVTGGGLLATMLKPITGLVRFFVSIGGLALKLASKIALPLAVIKGIYDFFEGFFEADKIIGKLDKNISIGERISVGISNVIAGLVTMVTDLLDLFGVETFDTTNLTKTIHEFFMGFPKMVTDFIDMSWKYVQEMYAGAANYVTVTIPQMAADMLKSMQDKTLGLYNDVITSLDLQIKDVKKGFVDAYASVVDKVTSIFTSISDTFKSVITAIESKLSDWKRSLTNIPGIGKLFTDDAGPDIKLDESALSKASADLQDMTSSTNLLRINEGVATMVPLETNSGAASTGVQRAEQKTAPTQPSPLMVNAPSTTVNNNTVNRPVMSTNTSNTNHKFRRLADGAR